MRRFAFSKTSAALIGGLALLLAACNMGVHSPAGFRLPENGDVARGKQAFIDLKCTACHTVDGVELPPPTVEPVIPLGGTLRELRTDGYLVTSIIHPSHRLGRFPKSETTVEGVEGVSRMPDFAMSMTVRELIDTVAFLREHYRFEAPRTMY